MVISTLKAATRKRTCNVRSITYTATFLRIFKQSRYHPAWSISRKSVTIKTAHIFFTLHFVQILQTSYGPVYLDWFCIACAYPICPVLQVNQTLWVVCFV